MKTIEKFPSQVREIENAWITLKDGCHLAARIWLPEDADQNPVPAILEYIPYRKRDGTVVRDHLTHPYLAGHGYACVRVDMRGNGESDGLMWDEYLKQEQDDALEVIDWLAHQPWCSGKVGMIGISWGGFNAPAGRGPPPAGPEGHHHHRLHRRPLSPTTSTTRAAACCWRTSAGPAPCSPTPRGRPTPRWSAPAGATCGSCASRTSRCCSNPGSSTSIATTTGSMARSARTMRRSRPPRSPSAAGPMPTRTPCPSSLPSIKKAPVKGLVGPWLHKYPHFAVPGPAIGFLQEALRWWDQFLKGKDTGVAQGPGLRRLHAGQRAAAPLLQGTPRPLDRRGQMAVQDHQAAGLQAQPRRPRQARHSPRSSSRSCSPQTTGVAAGEYCPIWLGPEAPVDQRLDDGGSLLFDTAPLAADIEIFGAPHLTSPWPSTARRPTSPCGYATSIPAARRRASPTASSISATATAPRSRRR